MLVILIEPIADLAVLAVLAGAKLLASLEKTGLVQVRVYRA